MLIVLSPAKSLDFETKPTTPKFTQPDFINRSAELIEILKAISAVEIGSLMGISDALATLNAARYQKWLSTTTQKNAKQAVLTFNGDVYEGLNAATLTEKQLDYVQTSVRILSGLYGVLRPLDLMQPYRLEMGTKLKTPYGKHLYAFWGDVVTEAVNSALSEQKSKILVNLASEEYFKVIKSDLLIGPIITPVFEDWKNGRYKIISFHAKRARGLMARYAAVKGITRPEKLQSFNLEGYAFDAQGSDAERWVFRRRISQ